MVLGTALGVTAPAADEGLRARRSSAGPDGADGGFLLHQPTHVVFGDGVADQVGAYASSFGRRALVVVGDRHARRSGLLARVQGSLGVCGIAVELLEGIPPNPSTAVVDAGAMLARTWKADVIVAVGGGSVLDAAKAIATAAVTGTPYRDHLSGLRTAAIEVAGTIPVVAVPTLPGSGSETNGTSVIVDVETGRKLSAHADVGAPRVALVDPLLALHAPRVLIAEGLVDALCHAIEAGLASRASIASDALAEQAVRLLMRCAAGALPSAAAAARGEEEAHLQALRGAWWASNLAGQALTLAGSIVTHPLAHALSARVDARHGAAVAALEGPVIARFAHRLGGRAETVATWFDTKPKSTDAAVRTILTRLARTCQALGVSQGVIDLGVDAEHVEMLVRDARLSGSRGLVGLPGPEPRPEELFEVLDLALGTTPTTPTKRLLEASYEIDSDVRDARDELEAAAALGDAE